MRWWANAHSEHGITEPFRPCAGKSICAYCALHGRRTDRAPDLQHILFVRLVYVPVLNHLFEDKMRFLEVEHYLGKERSNIQSWRSIFEHLFVNVFH